MDFVMVIFALTLFRFDFNKINITSSKEFPFDHNNLRSTDQLKIVTDRVCVS